MYSVEIKTTGLRSDQEKLLKISSYRQLVTGALLTLVNAYIIILLHISRRMAVNFFSQNHSKSSANHNQFSKSSSDHYEASKSPANNGPVFKSLSTNSNVPLQNEEVLTNQCTVSSSIPKISFDHSERPRASEGCMDRDFQPEDFQQENVRLKSDVFTFPTSSVDHQSSLGKPNSGNSCNEYESVSNSELVELLNNEEKVLLLDCRAFTAFNTNHINGALNVTCTDRITKKRLGDGKIGICDVISGHEGKEMYRQLEKEAVIVLYDEITCDLNPMPPSNPLKLISECLKKKGLTSKYLQGGLQSFQQEYSALCSQASDNTGTPLLYSPTSPEINCDIDSATASQILPHLYIGNQRDASSRERLTELGITHVLNVTSNLACTFESDNSFAYKRLAASDSCTQNLRVHFQQAIEFIEEARQSNGRVLVHCQAGVSRSPSIVIAYLMSVSQMTFTEAFQKVKDQRAIIAPNLNFMGQLLEFEQQVVRKEGLRPPSEPLHLLRL